LYVIAFCAEAGAVGSDSGLIRRDLLLLLVEGLLLRLQGCVLLFQCSLIGCSLHLRFVNSGLRRLCLLEVFAREPDPIGHELVLRVVGALHFARQTGDQSSHRHVFLAGL
jgi:hypothetical protein